MQPSLWPTQCEMRVKMYYFVVFQPSKCENVHIQHQIQSILPICLNDPESLQKVCYINWKKTGSGYNTKCRDTRDWPLYCQHFLQHYVLATRLVSLSHFFTFLLSNLRSSPALLLSTVISILPKTVLTYARIANSIVNI